MGLEVYANTADLKVNTYELLDAEEDQDTEEDGPEEELLDDNLLNLLDTLVFFTAISKEEFAHRQYLWKMDVHEIILPPPELV